MNSTTAFKEVIESNFNYVRIRGEISEIKPATKGQIYLTLKDNDSIINCVIWGSKKKYLQFKPELGIEVIATGKITTWSRYKTTYQIDIYNLEIAGEGALLKLIENRKKRLAAKGIFDEKYKKNIPFLPKKVGIITSPTGSVIHDIINRIKERFPIKVDLWPVLVQGKESTGTIVKAIKGFNDNTYIEKPDVIIIARGGGSVEDLMTFNDEELAIAVFESKIPIVSAIGHETDTTIIDYVSDLRAPTPTAAAEKVVPVRNELVQQVKICTERILHSMQKIIFMKSNLVLNLTSAYWTTREALPLMRKHQYGRILTIGSGYAKRSGGALAYTTAKHGLIGFTKALAAQVANDHITVNCLCPGWTNTALVDWEAMAKSRGTDANEAYLWAASQNLQERILEPEELGPMAALLAAPESAGITGQVISVDGGMAI